MRVRSGLLLVGAVVLAACASDGAASGPSRASFAGTYHAGADAYEASVFSITQAGATRDLLAEGALLDLTLAEDGTTSGRMFVPGGDEDGSDLDLDLTGTWTLTGDVVRLIHDADTFLRDVPFTLSDDRLSGEFQQDGVAVRAVFVRD